MEISRSVETRGDEMIPAADRWANKAGAAWSGAQTDRHNAMRREWLVALILSRKSSTWRTIDGMTEKIADKLRAGWVIYAAIRHHNAPRARELRNTYGYRRFMEMGALWVRYEFETEQAIDHLTSDLSTTAMTMQIIDAHDPRPEWFRRAQGMVKQSEVIFTSYDAPEDFKALIKPVLEYLNRYKL
jgi:hypothetical protein